MFTELDNFPCRHSMDIVLILVVALCTVETDIIHAIYLALALLLFRRRDDVQAAGNRIFVWLVIYNFAVNLAKIVYQAPLTLLFKGSWDFTADLVSSYLYDNSFYWQNSTHRFIIKSSHDHVGTFLFNSTYHQMWKHQTWNWWTLK